MSGFFLHWRTYDLPMQSPWPSAAGLLERRRGWILTLQQGPWKGFGDCAPLPKAGTETLEQAQTALEEAKARLAQGEAPTTLLPLPHRPAASCALQSALLDLESRRQGLPLSHLFSRRASPWARVSAMAGTPCRHHLFQALAAGFRVIKLKVGTRPWDEELLCLRTLCQRLPPAIRLRLDINGAWSINQAPSRLQALSKLPVEMVEEPLANPTPTALAQLQAITPFPLAVDESLAVLGIEPLLERAPVACLVIKPMAVGGPIQAWNLAKQALAAGMQPLLTSTLESALGLWTLAHLAAAWETLAPGQHHGLATAAWIAHHPLPPPPIKEGRIYLNPHPGIGVTP